MAKVTPSMAKNMIRRSLRAILDPPPKPRQICDLWDYFACKCAYCGDQLDRKQRNAHLDHVTPHSEGGSNSIYNHVLCCAKCNGDEKREEKWEAFLMNKCPDKTTQEQRRKQIKDWISQAPTPVHDQRLLAKQAKIIEEAVLCYEASVRRMRDLL